MESDIADFSNRRQAQTQRIQKAGLTASIGGGLLGGAISQSIQGVSPDGSAAVDDLTSGIQSAGQIITVFQGQIAKTASLFFLFNGAFNAVDTFTKGVEGRRRLLEQQESQTQRMTAGIDTAVNALSNLSSMMTDSTVTMDALNREQQKLADAIATISAQGPEGQKTANAINNTSDLGQKIQLLNFSKELQGRKLN